MNSTQLATTKQRQQAGVGELSRQAFESFVDLVGSQIRLAKTEIADDTKLLARRSILFIGFLQLLAVAYLFGCAALALGLSPWVGSPGAFAIVGGLNLVVGTIGCVIAWGRLKTVQPVEDTVNSVNETVTRVESAFQAAK